MTLRPLGCCQQHLRPMPIRAPSTCRNGLRLKSCGKLAVPVLSRPSEAPAEAGAKSPAAAAPEEREEPREVRRPEPAEGGPNLLLLLRSPPAQPAASPMACTPFSLNRSAAVSRPAHSRRGLRRPCAAYRVAPRCPAAQALHFFLSSAILMAMMESTTLSREDSKA